MLGTPLTLTKCKTFFAIWRQVRSKLESLDGIVPPTHGFMISSTGMKNVWLSMEHQAILWCNQLVVQVSRAFHLEPILESDVGGSNACLF